MSKLDEILQESDIWRQADEALTLRQRDSGDDYLAYEEDAQELFANPARKVLQGKPTFTLDAHGDVHVCFGIHCKHVALDHDRNWVCSASGNVVGIECAREQDPSWTGRSTGSSNPDDSAGTPIGGWIKKRDMYAASVAAYRSAKQICDDETMPPPRQPIKAVVATTPTAKRGALCVDEEAATPLAKRPRSSRKENWTRESLDKLASEALGVIANLFIANVDSRTVEAAATSVATPPLDVRMQSTEFVRPLALRSYVDACSKGHQELNLDTLTTVLIHANEYVRTQRALASDQARARARAAATKAAKTRTSTACFSGQVRNLLAQLIVSLWRAACLTKHFKTARKGNDSFHPFAAGILYQLKRGLYLSDGTCVVPVLEELSNHLPALRSASSSARAKQLQSSSHRGICSIQRSIASLQEMTPEEAEPALTLLKDAARQSAFLREMVSRS
jgi:hypothetical protein